MVIITPVHMNTPAHVAVAVLAMGKTVRVCPRVRMGERKTSLDLVIRPDVISGHELSGLHYD